MTPIDSPTLSTAIPLSPAGTLSPAAPASTRPSASHSDGTAPAHSTAPAHGAARPRSSTRLRRVALSLGLLLVEWATRVETHSAEQRIDHETLIRRHRTQRTLEQERRRAEARTLMAPLAW